MQWKCSVSRLWCGMRVCVGRFHWKKTNHIASAACVHRRGCIEMWVWLIYFSRWIFRTMQLRLCVMRTDYAWNNICIYNANVCEPHSMTEVHMYTVHKHRHLSDYATDRCLLYRWIHHPQNKQTNVDEQNNLWAHFHVSTLINNNFAKLNLLAYLSIFCTCNESA